MPDKNCLPSGTVLKDRYEIFETIGTGGFGITYRAFDQLLNRFVALKEFYMEQWMERGADGKECVISAPLQEEHVSQGLATECPVVSARLQERQDKIESCRQNFLREARIMEKLKNIPYLSRIQDCFSENKTEYIVMKLLTGETLAEFVKRKGPMPSGDFLPVLEQVLFAIEQMHELGFLHRDICPGNLLLTKDGDLYLIDFGSATACGADSELWNGQVFNHDRYEAPEHLSFAEQGTWTDIYSLCATIVYVLTGEMIPSHEQRAVNDALPGMLVRSGLTAKQQNVVLTGLALSRENRCAGAGQLRTALCGESVQAPQEWAVAYAARTDIGSRKMNQDNLMVDGLFCYEGEDFARGGQLDCSPDELHMAVICDGVGSSHSGELASRAAVQALIHFMQQYQLSERLPERLIDELLDQINEKIVSLGAKIGTAATTLSFLLWKGKHYWIVNIGDSPVYLLRKRKVLRMSIPHTRAYVRMLSGKTVSPSDLHMLMNYVGKEKTAGSQMAAIRHGHLEAGDVFLICSDGVTEFLDEVKLRKCLSKGEPQKCIDSIWKILGRQGSRDNCSAVILRF